MDLFVFQQEHYVVDLQLSLHLGLQRVLVIWLLFYRIIKRVEIETKALEVTFLCDVQMYYTKTLTYSYLFSINNSFRRTML